MTHECINFMKKKRVSPVALCLHVLLFLLCESRLHLTMCPWPQHIYPSKIRRQRSLFLRLSGFRKLLFSASSSINSTNCPRPHPTSMTLQFLPLIALNLSIDSGEKLSTVFKFHLFSLPFILVYLFHLFYPLDNCRKRK